MAGLIPWRHKKAKGNGNGGAVASARDFPSLMRRMQSEFDDLFERFGGGMSIFDEDFARGWSWGVDVEDKDDSVVVKAEAPGFEAGDFDIRVTGDCLTLRANRKSDKKDKEGLYEEKCECYEPLTLPAGIDKDKVDAAYVNGVLTVTIPKTKEGRAKKVTVKNG
jgi:HSP20 family protein